MAYDPVLERDLFRPKSRGVVSLDDTKEEEISDDLKARREQAQAMIDAAKEKFDPSNFQTLSEQARPGVFRPVAVNMPAQQPTADTAQRMQQMAAQGVRPVAMAKGGPVYHFADGGMKPTINSSGYTENLSSDEQDQLAKEKAAEATMGLRTLGAGTQPTDMLSDEERNNVRLQKTIKAPYDPYQLEGGIKDFVTYNRPDDPTTWTSDFKDAMVDKIYKDRLAARNTVAPDFRSYVEEPTREGIAKEIDKKAADISISRGQTRATEDAAKRKEALPDVRDYAQEREANASGIRIAEDAARREQAAPDKRDFDQERDGRDFISSQNIAQDYLGRIRAMPDKRDYAQEREAKGIMDLRDSVRTGDQPGAAADAARPAGATPCANAAPATGAAPAAGTEPAAGGLGSFKEAGESSDLGPMSIEGIRAERKREREENFNLALIQAGLAIMGGRSSNALANIGEGAQAGVRQFAAAESESKKLEREARRDFLEQQRAERDFREKQRQFGITSDLEGKRLLEATEGRKATQGLQAELGRGRLDLDKLIADQNWKTSQAKTTLDAKIAENNMAYQNGKLSLDQLQIENQSAKDLADKNYKSELVEIEKKKLVQPSETVKTAATLGGWDATAGKPPSADQIIAGLDRMGEKDEMATLEKLVRDPLVDEEIKKPAQARLNAILNRRSGSSSAGSYSEGQTATGPNGQKIIYKNGQWVPQ